MFKYFLSVMVVCMAPFSSVLSQNSTDSLKDWFNLDPSADSVQGMSVNKAYELLVNLEPREVIVAVIDSGVDIEHEDLKDNIWINKDEIRGNGIDDDKNGYVDDVYGWNFIGGPDGNVNEDTHEITRVYKSLKEKFGGLDKKEVEKDDKEEYEYWLKIKKNFENRYDEAQKQAKFYMSISHNYSRFYNLLKYYLDVEEVTLADLEVVESPDSLVNMGRGFLGYVADNMSGEMELSEIREALEEGKKYYTDQIEYTYNTEFNPRHIVGDDYDNLSERYYGNNDVEGPNADHGTHVAGIIAAKRNNGIGIDGVSNTVKIMSVRAVPNGDERDKDVANAIRYAVDNGAHIINMSFGKTYSPQKEVVYEAIKYAESKGILMVHAAGNSSKNIDVTENYPNRKISEKDLSSTWLEVGANSWGKDDEFVGDFSNYGRGSVDIFAPGVQVYSTVPDNKYEKFDGTSMAAPATSGLAALLMAYFPDLSAKEVRDIIVNSSRKFENLKVKMPGEDKKVNFSELSIHGGIINAYEAVKMAFSIHNEREN